MLQFLVTPALLLAVLAGARELHVEMGAGAGGDGSPGAPFSSISQGVNAMGSGDSLTVHAGTYTIGGPILFRDKQGFEAAPIVIRTQGEVIIQGGTGSVGTWQGVFDVRNCTWLVIDGFAIEGSAFFGIYIQDADHVTVENCRTNETIASGIASWTSTNITIRNNDIRAACNQGQRGDPNSACQECISLDHVYGFLVEGNHVHDAQQSGQANWGGGEGIDVKNGSSDGVVRYNHIHDLVQLGLYIEAWEADISNVEVYGNLVHNNANGIVITSEVTGNLSNVSVHDNVVYDCGLHGISFGHYQEGVSVDRLLIFNNTLVHNGYAENQPYFMDNRGPWFSGLSTDRDDVTNVMIRDNIVYDNASGQITIPAGLPGLTFTHNLTGAVEGDPGGQAGDNPILADPAFVRFGTDGNRDLRLSEGSAAVDAGLGGEGAATVDFDKNPRVINGQIDLGAFEYSPGLALGREMVVLKRHLTSAGDGMKLFYLNGRFAGPRTPAKGIFIIKN
jgi:parallel beta-helix repeat protein